MNEGCSNGAIQIDVHQISQELRIRPEVYLRILLSFAASLQTKVNMLDEALAAQDHEAMRKILHEIKGTAGNLRLKNISSAEEVLHYAVKLQEDQEKLKQCAETLRSESQKLYQYVQQIANP